MSQSGSSFWRMFWCIYLLYEMKLVSHVWKRNQTIGSAVGCLLQLYTFKNNVFNEIFLNYTAPSFFFTVGVAVSELLHDLCILLQCVSKFCWQKIHLHHLYSTKTHFCVVSVYPDCQKVPVFWKNDNKLQVNTNSKQFGMV